MDTPLTEKRFLELITEILAPIKTTLKKLESFQKNEAGAIEFELRMLLEKYIEKEYGLMEKKEVPKAIIDPFTNKELTDFDVAFILAPSKKHIDYSRLTEEERKSVKSIKDRYQEEEKKIFMIAEAKHYIDSEKVRYKLHQFDKLNNIFKIANLFYKTDEPEQIIRSFNLQPKFIRTLEGNKKLFSNINKSIIFFGASFWENNLLQNMENDIQKRNDLITQFKNERADSPIKIGFYKKICVIETKWYNPGEAPNNPNLEDNRIRELTEIHGALNHVKFIKPSGERYRIEEPREPVGFAFGGKRKTQRKKNK
jgi:hypothetical protein